MESEFCINSSQKFIFPFAVVVIIWFWVRDSTRQKGKFVATLKVDKSKSGLFWSDKHFSLLLPPKKKYQKKLIALWLWKMISWFQDHGISQCLFGIVAVDYRKFANGCRCLSVFVRSFTKLNLKNITFFWGGRIWDGGILFYDFMGGTMGSWIKIVCLCPSFGTLDSWQSDLKKIQTCRCWAYHTAVTPFEGPTIVPPLTDKNK